MTYYFISRLKLVPHPRLDAVNVLIGVFRRRRAKGMKANDKGGLRL